MSVPPGSILDGAFIFLAGGVPTNPMPTPTVTLCSKPNGTTVAPPALTNPSVGIFYAAQLFGAADTTASGFYQAIASTTDATVDNPMWVVEWEVEPADASAPTVPQIVAGVWNGLNADYAVPGSQSALLASIRSGIGAGTWTVISPTTTNEDGTVTITLTKGDDYFESDGFQIVFEVPAGYPADLTGATAVLNLPPDLDPVTAVSVDNSFIKFDISRDTTQYLIKASGQLYSVVVTLAGIDGHVVTPTIGILVVVVR